MAEGTIQMDLTIGGVTTPISPLGDQEAWLETRDLDLGNDKQLKFLEGLLFELREIAVLGRMQVELGLKDRLTDAVTWYSALSLSSGNVPIWLEGIPTTRYVRLRITDTSITGLWKLSALEILGSLDGGPM